VVIRKRTYSDGGILNNFAVEPLLNECGFIIGVYTNPINELVKMDSMRKIAERTFDLATLQHGRGKSNLCDVYIESDSFKKFGIFDIKSSKDIFQAGYQACLDRMKEIEIKITKKINASSND